MKRGEGGSALPMLLLLLLVLAGGMAWNYRQNVAAEQAVDRPYRGYSDEELAALLGAYEGRHGHQSAQLKAASGRRAVARDQGYFDEQVAEFERVQRVSQQAARAREQLAGTQAVVKRIQEEKRLRANDATGLALHLKRALTPSW